jgi:HlyD family secretion protein
MARRIIIGLIIVLIAGYTGYRLYTSSQSAKETLLSGFIEGTEVLVRSQAAGPIISIDLKEGDVVRKGQVIASVKSGKINHELDSMNSEIASLDVNIRSAEQSLTLMEKTVERGIKKADAGLKISREQLKDMKNGYPAEDVQSAEIAAKLAFDNLDYASIDLERFQNLLEQGVVSKKEFESVEQRFKAAEREYEIRNEAYLKLKRGYDSEKVSQAARNVDIAELSYQDATAGRDEIVVKRNDIEGLKRKRDSLQSQIDLLKSRIDDYTITAPVDGVIDARHVEIGELVSSGSPVVSIIKPDEKWIRVYVAATDLADISLGKEYTIRLDTYTDRTFKGKVSFISQDAEFTPKNVQIKKERVKQVYEVRLDIVDNPELVKTGMEGDVVLKSK